MGGLEVCEQAGVWYIYVACGLHVPCHVGKAEQGGVPRYDGDSILLD
jgi:hypothetical protein